MDTDYRLYLIVDPEVMDAEQSATDVVGACIENGATVIQYRDKHSNTSEMYRRACELREVTRRYSIPLIINDRLDLMFACQADGVHVGKEDLPLPQVRRLVPDGALIGYSVDNVDDVLYAQCHGATYVSAGPVFPTSTKHDAGPVLGIEGLRTIVTAAQVPCVAIGGITGDKAPDILNAGAAGVCTISAVWKPSTGTPAEAVRELRRKLEETGG